MAVAETIISAISSAWARGSLFLAAVGTACLAASVALLVCARAGIEKAAVVWSDYGLGLILATLVLLILTIFKWLGERKPPSLSLTIDERNSFWARSKQQDGTITTQFTLRMFATNMGDSSVHFSAIKLKWPFVTRKSILTTAVMTRHPNQNVFGSEFPVNPHSRTELSAIVIANRAVGGKKREMRVSVGLRDHAGRWHKVVFPHLKNPTAS